MSTMRARIVVVDDERMILEAWVEALGQKYEVVSFSDAVAARLHFESHDIDVALLDLRMPGMDGMALLAELRRVQPKAEVIVVTGHGTIETAVQAMQMGAYDFLCKPITDLDAAVRRVDSAVAHKELRDLNATLRERLDAHSPDTTLIGESREMQKVRALITQIANAPTSVLIVGESGTGKELAARSLHTQSHHTDKPFIAVNCGAISETLIDSELFGHERGAFTGAVAAHRGLFEAAHGGTLFLDEIGDVPAPTQVRLLRALQEGEIRAVGSAKSRKVEVRVICATNVDLDRAKEQGKFREDLYYRISTFRLELPPLRKHREDIPLIAQHLLDKYAKRSGRHIARFSDEALAALMAYDWPGNVRELANAVEHAAILCTSDTIDGDHFPSFVTTRGPTRRESAPVAGEFGSVASQPYSQARDQLLSDFDQRYLQDLLSSAGGNLSEAARRSGVDRSNLRRMLRRYAIRVEGFKDEGAD